MINKYTGDVALRLAGWPDLTLCFDWQSIATLQSTFPDKAIDVIVRQDALALLDLALIGLRRHHPDLTLEDLRGFPAQVAPLGAAVGTALALAYNGPGDGKSAANPPNRATRRAARKTATRRRTAQTTA